MFSLASALTVFPQTTPAKKLFTKSFNVLDSKTPTIRIKISSLFFMC